MNSALTALLIATTGALCMAADKPNDKANDTAAVAKKGERPVASPGWVIVEEDFWFPLRFEPLYSLDSARYHYRRREEKAAANEIDKTVSWLKLAAAHAMPITKEKLTAAMDELTTVAKDLRAGNITAAERLDASLARAAHALADWHYYKAKESWGKNEEQDAGHNLELAAEYLQHAANSAHYQFGPDTQEVITKTYHDGKVTSESTHFDHNTLGLHLQAIEKAVKELGETMNKAAQ
jgi:hypothetical protein